VRSGILAGGLGALIAIVGVGRSAVPEPIGDPDPKDRQAFVAVCGACHPVSLVDGEVRSYDDWRATVQAMVDRGAKGTDEQFERIDTYLYLTMTAIDVNRAAAEDVAAILGLSTEAADRIVARRETRPFATIADLAAVAGVPVTRLDARKKRIGF
jgi:hypothetical protein